MTKSIADAPPKIGYLREGFVYWPVIRQGGKIIWKFHMPMIRPGNALWHAKCALKRFTTKEEGD